MTDREELIKILENLLVQSYPIEDNLNTSEFIADYLLNNHITVLPCREGDTIYKIVKFCEENIGYAEEYKPSKEFNEDCPYFQGASWYDDADECEAVKDYLDRQYCNFNLKIFCDKCKERLVVQKDKFTLSKVHKIYNAPMFNENTELKDTYFRTKEEAEKALEKLDFKR